MLTCFIVIWLVVMVLLFMIKEELMFIGVNEAGKIAIIILWPLTLLLFLYVLITSWNQIIFMAVRESWKKRSR